MTKGVLRFFFEYGAGGCLWAGDAATHDRLGAGPVDAEHGSIDGQVRPARLALSDLACNLKDQLDFEHSGYLNPLYPPDPSLWTQDLCHRFNAKVEQLLDLLQEELGEQYDILDQQIRYVQDPGLELYLTKHPELSAISQVDEAVIRRLWGEPRVLPSGEVIQSLPSAKVASVRTFDEFLVDEIIVRASRVQ